ncbi:hypothetical protein GCM10028820_24910 [Tessaracoccus terricola]
MSRRDIWRVQGTTSGVLSPLAMIIWLLAGAAWLCWPIWSSANAPTRPQQEELTGWVLAALGSLALVLGWSIWLDARRRLAALAPVVLLASATVAARFLLGTGVTGVEPVFAGPLLAGMVLGAPAGFLTGLVACAASAVASGTVDAPLPGQLLVWGLWGLLGGLLRRVPDVPAWLLATAMSVPMGVFSGLLLNLTGWAVEESVRVGASIPGAGPLDQLRALWAYSADTSLAVDTTRGATVALLLLCLGLPLLRALRQAWAPVPDTTGWELEPEPLNPSALRRRHTELRGEAE